MKYHNGSAGCPPPASSVFRGLISSSVQLVNTTELVIMISRVNTIFFIVDVFRFFGSCFSV